MRFNPVLLKPGSDLLQPGRRARRRRSTRVDAGNYRALKPRLRGTVFETLAELRTEFDVVICEGAGSPAEINLRDGDFANMGLARHAGLPTIVVGDIDRGGVFASLFGTLALLDADDQALVAGLRDQQVPRRPRPAAPGLDTLGRSSPGGRRTAYCPWHLDLWLDAEDSLAYGSVLGRPGAAARRATGCGVAVVRLPRISNATDAEALAAEPGVRVRLTVEPAELADADLVVLPGSKSTVDDLAWLRETRPGRRGARARGAPGGRCSASAAGSRCWPRASTTRWRAAGARSTGSACCRSRSPSAPRKTLTLGRGTAADGMPVRGYEIHHGYVSARRRPAAR